MLKTTTEVSPILRSITNPKFLENYINDKYDLGKIKNCKGIKYGGSNDIFLIITETKKYIAKIFFGRKSFPYTKHHYLFELEFQKFLHNNELFVAEPILNFNNELLDCILLPDGLRYFAIYSFVQGEKWDHTFKKENRMKLLGKTIGKLHKISQNFNKSTTRNLNLELMLEKSWADIKTEKKCPNDKIKKEMEKHYLELTQNLKEFGVTNLVSNIIHGDVHAGNNMYCKKKNRLSLIDFELCGRGYYPYEFATLKWDLCKSHTKEFTKKCMSEFLDGYSLSHSINHNDLALINIFVKVRMFFMLGSSFLFYSDQPQYNNIYNWNYCLKLLQKNF